MKAKVAAAIAERVRDGDVIGVGTGSTVEAALAALGSRVRSEKLQIAAVPTSYQSAWSCERNGIQVLHPACYPELRWGFDGADAVDPRLRVIKGRGGAMLQEKILAARCREYLIIVDDSKLVDNIASKSPVPVEVIPEAAAIAERELTRLGAASLEVRKAVAKHGPVITERGNLIFDTWFNEIHDGLEREIKQIVGVVESGLFLNFATEVLVASAEGVRTIRR